MHTFLQRLILACGLVATSAAQTSRADIVVADRDTRLASSPHNGNNYGASDTFALNSASRELLYFDIDSFVTSVTSAVLRIYQIDGFPGGDKVLDVHELSDANHDWIEGSGNGTAAGAGEPGWDFREAALTPWAGSAGASTAGIDYDFMSIGGQTNDFVSGWWEIQLSVSVVEAWRQDEADNNGIIINFSGPGGSSLIFATSENSDTSLRPYLDIGFAAIPEPASLAFFTFPVFALLFRRRIHR